MHTDSGHAMLPPPEAPPEQVLTHLRRRRGTFVELGAYDGLRQSNTAWLEAHRGWRGILVEAIPEAYESCVRNRPRATVVNCACVSDDYSDPTIEMVYAGLMSIVRGARSTDEADEAWVALGEELQELERYTCTVPARTLSAVLDEQGLRTIDLLSVDVEGYEVDVLEGFDLERFAPGHIVVEDSREGEVDRYLTARGYRQVAVMGRGRLTVDLLYERNGGHGSGAGSRHVVGRWRFFVRAEMRHLVAAVRRRRVSARRA
jgi:FkbM family methyltransferase